VRDSAKNQNDGRMNNLSKIDEFSSLPWSSDTHLSIEGCLGSAAVTQISFLWSMDMTVFNPPNDSLDDRGGHWARLNAGTASCVWADQSWTQQVDIGIHLPDDRRVCDFQPGNLTVTVFWCILDDYGYPLVTLVIKQWNIPEHPTKWRVVMVTSPINHCARLESSTESQSLDEAVDLAERWSSGRFLAAGGSLVHDMWVISRCTKRDITYDTS
jgi:hypothetical protein